MAKIVSQYKRTNQLRFGKLKRQNSVLKSLLCLNKIKLFLWLVNWKKQIFGSANCNYSNYCASGL